MMATYVHKQKRAQTRANFVLAFKLLCVYRQFSTQIERVYICGKLLLLDCFEESRYSFR